MDSHRTCHGGEGQRLERMCIQYTCAEILGVRKGYNAKQPKEGICERYRVGKMFSPGVVG